MNSIASIATESGTTVSLHTTTGGRTVVRLDHPDSPDHLRNFEIGQIKENAFLPRGVFGAGSQVLRAIADLLDEGA